MAESARIARSFAETLTHYRNLRLLSHQLTEQEYSHLGVRLSDIQLQDTLEADKWSWSDPEKTPIWTWSRMYEAYRSARGAKRFDVALRAGGGLQALCYGIPSRRRLILKLHALSRSPLGNPLQGQVFQIVLFAAGTYASFLGSQELWLMHPQTDGVAQYYARFGFHYHRDRSGQITHMTTKL